MTTERKYSLRKFKVGVASVLVGIGVATTGAAVAHASDAEVVVKKTADLELQVDKPKETTETQTVNEAVKTAEAKVTEAQTKVDTATTAANEANTKLEAKKKEAADADAAKTKAAEAKKAVDADLEAAKAKAAEADAKAKEEAKKEADETKKQADTKAELTAALEKLEKDAVDKVNNNAQISDKAKAIEEVKATIGKEDLLKAIEAGDIKATDAADALPSENDANGVEGPTTPATSGDKNALPADLKAKIDEAEKADAARPKSEKLQDKADNLGEEIDALKKDTEALKAEEDKKAEALKKQEATLKEAKEALKSATDNELSSDIVTSLDKAVKTIEKAKESAEDAFNKAAEDTQAYAEELNKLTDEYNKALDEVKTAKEEEAKNPPKKEEPTPETSKEKTEAEKAAEAKKVADDKVIELENKVAEETKKVEEATAKAEQKAADVKAAEKAKADADKVKEDANAELTKAKEDAEKAKEKVEELKKEEADSLKDITNALTELENDAIAKIKSDDRITDKEEAIQEIKDLFGKEDLLKAIQAGEISAAQAAKDFEDAVASKDSTPVEYQAKELSPEDKKIIDALNKKEEARPIVEKLGIMSDVLTEKIGDLTIEADYIKAEYQEKLQTAVKEAEKLLEEKTAALDKQKETLEKAKTALTTAEKNNADKAIQDGLQDAVNRLEASVSSAKADADKAKTDADKANDAKTKIDNILKDYADEIQKLTDDKNEILGSIENLKEIPKGEESKDFSRGVNDDEAPTEPAKEADEVPTAPNAPEFSGGVNPSDSPSGDNGSDFNGGVNPGDAPSNGSDFNGGVNDDNATTQPNNPDFNSGVNDGNAPTQPNNPDFNGGVNDGNAPSQSNNPDAPKPTEKPQHSNGQEAPVNYVPELGNVDKLKLEAEIAEINEALKTADPVKAKELTDRLQDLEEALKILSAQLSPVLEKPEFDLSTLLGTPAGDGNSFGPKTPEPKQETKVDAKAGRVLPNTGMNSSSTAALGLSLIALAGIAVRRKLSK